VVLTHESEELQSQVKTACGFPQLPRLLHRLIGGAYCVYIRLNRGRISDRHKSSISIGFYCAILCDYTSDLQPLNREYGYAMELKSVSILPK